MLGEVGNLLSESVWLRWRKWEVLHEKWRLENVLLESNHQSLLSSGFQLTTHSSIRQSVGNLMQG